MMINGIKRNRYIFTVGDYDLQPDKYIVLYSKIDFCYDTMGLVFFEDRKKLYEDKYLIASKSEIEELKKLND
jgi:hypothetical protein